MKGKEHISEIAELASYKILDTLPEKEYDDIAGIASQICKTPISLISFLDAKRQFFKAHQGLDIQETPINQSFCLHAVKSKEEILIVEDARKDPRFSNNPLVKGEPQIVFYAGVPFFTPSGNALGALCVIDTKPRKFNESQKTALKVLADQVVKLLELRKKQYELEGTKKILQEEKDRLNNIIEATQVGTFEWDLETDEIRINRRWAEMVGYTLEELRPVNMDTWYKLVHPDDVTHSDAALKLCFDKKVEFYDVEIRMIHKEGYEIWINDRGRVVKWSDDGKPLFMSGTHTDITDRKNTEIQFKNISDNIPGVVYRYKLYEDGRDELQMVSNGANFLWGIPPESAMKDNQLVWERYHKDDLEDHRASIRKSAESLSFWTHEWRYLHPDGSEHWHKGTGVPKKMEDGSTVWDAVILDITEQRIAEKNLGTTLISLQERIKEQQCLYQITSLSYQEVEINNLLNKAVNILPSGWKFPEHTTAKIEFNGNSYTSPHHAPSEWSLDTHFSTKEGKPLDITISYQKSLPGLDEGPFLKEERQLLETVTHNLSIAIDQMEASENLKQSNRKIDGIIQTIDCIVWEANIGNLRPTFVSRKVNNILGYTTEAWLADPDFWQNHIHPEDRENVLSFGKAMIEAGKDHNLEYRMLAADGSEVWINDLITVVKENGKPVALRGLMVDVTKRNLAEKELQLSEQRFRSLVQNGSDLIAILDFEANYQYVSPTSETILGIPPQDFIDKNAFDFIHPDDKEAVLFYFSGLKSSSRISIPPFRFKHQDGTWRWIETVVTNMMDDPSIKGIVANSRDITQKIISERKLEQSEKRFKALVQQGADLTAILNLEGEYVYVSPNFPQIVGFSENELIGKKASEFFHPDDLRKIELEFQEMAIKKKIKSSPYRFKNKSGGWRWLQSVATNLLKDEAVRGIIINSVEITELIEAQDKLKTSEARYRGFYESQTNFVIRTDLEGNYSYVNKKFIEDFGWIYPDGKIIGKNCLPSICDYEHQRVFEVVEKCMANPEKVYKIEIDKPRKGGGTVTTLWDFICMVDRTGIPQEIQCMGIDISDRIKFERALQKSNERYEKISEATNDAIWDFDAENNRLMWGKGFTSLFGYDLEKIKPDFDFLRSLIHPEDRERVGQKIGEFMESTTLTNWFEEYRFLMADGYYAFVMDRAVFIRNNEGKVARVVGAMTDISYRKEYEESLHALNEQLEQHARELEISNKELEQFAYVASHDLQEPLRMVSSFIGLLERRYGHVLDEKAHQYINYAVGGAKRMRQIILDLLEFSRVGKSEVGLKIIALDEVLDEVCLLQRKRIAEKGATIEYADLPTMITYRAPMMQIFQNLIENSLRYSRDDQSPVIKITSQLKDNQWLFAVKDNGIGIDPQFHDKIFIIFQSLHNKEKYGGTGMGLAIVKKIVENLGGRIWLDSEEGKGTTFYFTLPKTALKPGKELPELLSSKNLK